MISLFLGLSTGNVLLLGLTMTLGWFATDAHTPTSLYVFHITIGIAAGLMATLTHTAVYMYFMATSRWLQAATNKANLDPSRFVNPAMARKHRVLGVAMAAITMTVLTLFSGAAADPTVQPWLPANIHMAMGLATLMVNLIAAVAQFPLVRQQSLLMDQTLSILNR